MSGNGTAGTARSVLQAEKFRLVRMGEKRLKHFLYNIGESAVFRILREKFRKLFPDNQRLFQHGLIRCQFTDSVTRNRKVVAAFKGLHFLRKGCVNRKTLAVPLLRIAQFSLRFGDMAEVYIAER